MGLATAKLLSGAHIVRAFNAINYATLSTMPSCRRTRTGWANSSGFQSPATTRTLLISRRPSSERLVSTLLYQRTGYEQMSGPGMPLSGKHMAAEIWQIVTNLH
jgi:hypothetical protein